MIIMEWQKMMDHSNYFMVVLESMLTSSSSEYVDEQTFYDWVRQCIISLLAFLCIFFASYLIVRHYKSRKISDTDSEDDLVFKVAVCLCCFTMTISIGAVLLLPFSIFSNEIILSYPDSWHFRWLNESLIQCLWNQIFLGTYVAMFLAMPFAYFLTESEGFSGSRKGIKAKIYETFMVLFLILLLGSTLVWVFSSFGSNRELTWVTLVTENWFDKLSLIYSYISFMGALLLLICAPYGFAQLFTVLADNVVKPKFFVDFDDLDNQIQALKYEEENIAFNKRRSENNYNNNDIYLQKHESSPEHSSSCKSTSLAEKRKRLERQRKASSFEKNFLFPICLIGLLSATVVCMLMVAMNSLALIFGSESELPFRNKYPSLGKISISRLGWFGILLQIFLIFYVMMASLVGLYNAPGFAFLKPKPRKTSMVKLIGNCILLLILSAALPVLARTLGITNFNLMGGFARLDWLANYRLVLFYNVFFEVTTSLCLTRQFTKSLRDALSEHFQQYSKFKSWKRWKRD